jgi:uncharacterized protein YfdQ (DUF2303 family)
MTDQPFTELEGPAQAPEVTVHPSISEAMQAAIGASDIEIIPVSERELVALKVLPPGYSLGHMELPTLTPSAPKTMTRRVWVDDLGSFLDYLTRHADASLEVWVETPQRATWSWNAQAVIDAPMPHLPTYMEHRVGLRVAATSNLLDWLGGSGKALRQADFAEFLEAHLADVSDPTLSASTLLEIAQTFRQTTKAVFGESIRLKDGQQTMSYTEEAKASAGAKGDLTIPDQFQILVRVWDDFPQAVRLTARLRTRVIDGHLVITYIIDRVDDARIAAAEEARNQVEEGLLAAGLEALVLRGPTPN